MSAHHSWVGYCPSLMSACSILTTCRTFVKLSFISCSAIVFEKLWCQTEFNMWTFAQNFEDEHLTNSILCKIDLKWFVLWQYQIIKKKHEIFFWQFMTVGFYILHLRIYTMSMLMNMSFHHFHNCTKATERNCNIARNLSRCIMGQPLCSKILGLAVPVNGMETPVNNFIMSRCNVLTHLIRCQILTCSVDITLPYCQLNVSMSVQ